MPYIKETERAEIDEVVKRLYEITGIHKPGRINYAITRLFVLLVECDDNMYGKGYAKFNVIIGILECLKLELYRRMVAAYEDEKRIENGDVF